MPCPLGVVTSLTSLATLLGDGTRRPWTGTTEWANGLFKGGKAEAQVYGDVCARSCGSFRDIQSVTLSASKK